MEIHLGVWEYVLDWLPVQPKFLFCLLFLGVVSISVTKTNQLSRKISILVSSLILFFYMSVMLSSILGTPTLSELSRMSESDGKIFYPTINIIPFNNGISGTFLLNTFIFVPVGILCPFISETYRKLKYSILFAFSVSLFIETSRLFTRHMVTDINDLIANTIGMIVGYSLLKIVTKMTQGRFWMQRTESEPNTWILPILVVFLAFTYTFLI